MIFNFLMRFDWIRFKLEKMENDRVKYLGK